MLYRDTMGFWDELVVKDGQFSHFAPIHETDLQRAIIKARSGRLSEPADLSAALFAHADASQETSQRQKDSSQQERGGRSR